MFAIYVLTENDPTATTQDYGVYATEAEARQAVEGLRHDADLAELAEIGAWELLGSFDLDGRFVTGYRARVADADGTDLIAIVEEV